MGRYWSLIDWLEVGEVEMIGLDIIYEAMEKFGII